MKALSYLKKFAITATLLFLVNAAQAQNYLKIQYSIDSLLTLGLPKSALVQVDKLDALARKDNNVPEQVKASLYRMMFQSYSEENSLVAIISRLKTDVDKAEYPVKPVLQSLLAGTYFGYYQQNRWLINKRTRLQKPSPDFTDWDLQTILDEVTRLYKLSLADYKREQNTPIDVLDGILKGDANIRYLRPTLYDMLLQRSLDFFLSDEPAITKPRLPFSVNDERFFGDSHAFAKLIIKTTDTASTYYNGIRLLQQASIFHQQKPGDEVLADLDIKRLTFLRTKTTLADKDTLYTHALKHVAATFSAKPISADALLTLGRYYNGINKQKYALAALNQAVKTYPQSYGGKNAAAQMADILQKHLSANLENVNLPGQPLLAQIAYRNVSAIKLSVYKLTSAQWRLLNSNYYENSRIQLLSLAGQLRDAKPIQQQSINLSDPGDYRDHRTEVKIDPLAMGQYMVKITDTDSPDSSLIQLTSISVTRLAGIARINPNSKVEVRVADRESGAPLNNVLVKILNNGIVSQTGYTNSNGLYNASQTDNRNISFDLALNGDTLYSAQRYVGGATYDADDDKEKDDDRTVLFTDRQIYRPGQTVYFKGLQLIIYKNKTLINTKDSVSVEFKDENYKALGKQHFKLNDFGTFAGKFVIPQSVLPGRAHIETDNGEIDIQIEEYKRPTFKTDLQPIKTVYRLNDSVTLNGRVTAFSGYGLSRAEVAYHITRTQKTPYVSSWGTSYYDADYNNRNAEVKTDTIETDDQGNFRIKFKAVPGEVANLASAIFAYDVSIDVTDESGETHSANTSIKVGNHNNVQIAAFVPGTITAKDTGSIPINIKNLNDQAIKGRVKIQIYSLQSPGRLFKKRLWAEPDQYQMSKGDYKVNFPYYTYHNEDEPASWKRMDEVSATSLNISDTVKSLYNFKALLGRPSGVYQVLISAQGANGDTTSITRYVRLIGDKPATPKLSDWVTMLANAVKGGQDAQFLVGIDKPSHVLMEVYRGPKLVTSQWLNLPAGQQLIKVPTNSKDADLNVQFMMVYQNRVYNSYQKIYIQNAEKWLDIKFLTYRDKLQPGQKEQWKLQVSAPGDEKQAAEMVASLYDASLDDLTRPQDWQNMLESRQRYHPDYFNWTTYGFISQQTTIPMVYKYYRFNYTQRNYEVLDMMGYSYYGGYNNGFRQYVDAARKRMNISKGDLNLEDRYRVNAGLVKNGVDITGKIIDEEGQAVIGAAITIKGSSIGIVTGSEGTFKIKVPVGEVLKINFIGYETREITITKADKLKITLKAMNNALNEVVVVGYGTEKKSNMLGSVATVTRLNGGSFLQGTVAGLSIKADTSNFVSGGTAKRLDDTEDLAFTSIDQAIKTRTNFNETAFFYPQLRTDAKGEILIDFTIPESLTKWKFKAFAHTTDLKTGYIESTLVTQKQLSITANTPRFLREGDTITISARLSNLTNGALKTKVKLQLLNAVNMQPVNLLVNPANAQQNFDLAAQTNKAVSFKLFIPFGIDALTYKLTADAGTNTDGEENTLPILPNRMLVTESMPMMVRGGQTRAFTFDKLINQNSTTLKNKILTLEYTQNPAWYAIQALPYMMEFPYECSEQIFSRYYANSLGTSLVNKMPIIKQTFDQWKSATSTELLSNLEKNQELKTTLLEETPWLRDATDETERKKRVALLFDLDKMSYELRANLDKLKEKQLSDGGFPWFAGDRSDGYITRHVLAGIGQLYHLGIVDTKNITLKSIADKAMSYLDDELLRTANWQKNNKSYEGRNIYSTEIHSYYTQSYFTARQMSTEMKALTANYLAHAEDQWLKQDIYEQGMIALTMLRNGKADVTQKIINSLKERAQTSDDMGMYWGKNQRGYYWYQSPVETQSLMIELFTEAGNNDKAVEEMKIWLLRNKQTNDWKTTKATAAACYALLLKGDNWLADNATSIIKLDNKPLTDLKPDLKAEAGTGYIKTNWADEQVKPAMGKVSITNNGKTISWGALHWQYLENLDKISPSSTEIRLERKYFIQKQTDRGAILTEVDATHKPKPGDLLKVVVYLKAGRDYEYVQLKDMRPAGTEPVDVLSTYKYQDGLHYYQVTKDVATNFFISNLNKGNYVFEYRLRVAQPGNFSTGISTVQCMYAPEFNAHSEGSRMTVGN